MKIRLVQLVAHAPWQVGEIVTVQVAAVADAGAYECETLETYPPDIKEQHAKAITAAELQADLVVRDRERQLHLAVAEIDRLKALYEPAPVPAKPETPAAVN